MKRIASAALLLGLMSTMGTMGLTGCASVPTAAPPFTLDDPGRLLLFQSGFEGNTAVEPIADGNHRLVGRDGSLPSHSDWGADMDRIARPGMVTINYTGGQAHQRYADIVADPTRPANKVLRFWLGDAFMASDNQVKARVQMDLYGITPGLRDFSQSVRVFLHEDFRLLQNYPRRITWLTLGEFWNNEWWVPGEPYGFRVTVGIGKPEAAAGELRFHVEAEDAGQIKIWHHADRAAKAPIGQWFTMEYRFREGNAGSGRFMLAITPEGGPRRVLYDVTGFTHNTADPAPNGVSGYNPMKLYTSKEVVAFMKDRGKPLQVYWDDLRIWKHR